MNGKNTNFPFIAKKVSDFADLVFRIGTPIGLLIIYLLGSKFATKEELEEKTKEQDKRTAQIETTIAVMVEQNRVNEWQNDLLADHEDRIRNLEMAGK